MTLADALIVDGEGEMRMYFAGRAAPKGLYLNVESGQLVSLEDDDTLPASLDGHVAAYVTAPNTWGELRVSNGSTRSRRVIR